MGHSMSTTSQGPGWWLASDGKWYPPELWKVTARLRPAQRRLTPATHKRPALRCRATAAWFPYGLRRLRHRRTPYCTLRPGRPKKTNGLAIAALVCGCAGFLLFIPAHPRHHLRLHRPGADQAVQRPQKGDGMAIAGIIVGFGWLALLVLDHRVRAAHSNNGNSGVVNPAILLGQLGLGHLPRSQRSRLTRGGGNVRMQGLLYGVRGDRWTPPDGSNSLMRRAVPDARCGSRSSTARHCSATTGASPRRA